METVDSDAKTFLAKVIRTNAITFADDLATQRWSSGYYVKTAIYQLGELTGTVIPYGGSPQSIVRHMPAVDQREKFRAQAKLPAP